MEGLLVISTRKTSASLDKCGFGMPCAQFVMCRGELRQDMRTDLRLSSLLFSLRLLAHVCPTRLIAHDGSAVAMARVAFSVHSKATNWSTQKHWSSDEQHDSTGCNFDDTRESHDVNSVGPALNVSWLELSTFHCRWPNSWCVDCCASLLCCPWRLGAVPEASRCVHPRSVVT